MEKIAYDNDNECCDTCKFRRLELLYVGESAKGYFCHGGRPMALPTYKDGIVIGYSAAWPCVSIHNWKEADVDPPWCGRWESNEKRENDGNFGV